MKKSRQTVRDENRQRAVHDKHQKSEETKLATHEFDVVRSNIFNLYSVRSVLIANLKTKIVYKQKCKNLNWK